MSDVVSWMVEISIKSGQLDNFKAFVEEQVQSARNDPWGGVCGSVCAHGRCQARADALMIGATTPLPSLQNVVPTLALV